MSLIILNTIVSIYKKPDANGFQKLIKRNVLCKKVFDSNNILPEHYIKPNGDISKRWCQLKEGDSYYIIGHSFEHVTKLIEPIYVKGYKRW